MEIVLWVDGTGHCPGGEYFGEKFFAMALLHGHGGFRGRDQNRDYLSKKSLADEWTDLSSSHPLVGQLL